MAQRGASDVPNMEPDSDSRVAIQSRANFNVSRWKWRSSDSCAALPGTLLEDSKNKASLTTPGDVVEKPGMSMKNLIIALQRLL